MTQATWTLERSYASALALLCSDRGYDQAESVAKAILSTANRQLVTTTGKVRAYYSPESGMYRVNAVYSSGTYLEAVPQDSEEIPNFPPLADYAVFTVNRDSSDLAKPRPKAVGYITDARQPDDPLLSDWREADEDARPYEVYAANARTLLGDYSSLGACMLRIVNQLPKRR